MQEIVAYSGVGPADMVTPKASAREWYNLNMYDPNYSAYDAETPYTHRTLWHYLVFPVDAWQQGQRDDWFESQKADEIWPMMIFLLPGIVLLAAFSLRLGFFSRLFFYGFEAGLLAVVCKFYAALEQAEHVLELFFNFWAALVLQAFCFMLLFGFFSIFL